MTRRLTTKYKICKRYNADIWGRLYINKKLTKFSKTKAPRPRTNISIGSFKGILVKRPKTYRRRRTRYGRNLKTKQKLFNFYGTLKNYQLKKYLLDQKHLKKNVFKSLISHLEKRLDVLLFRSNFVASIFFARQYIIHRKCAVNNIIKPYINFIVRKHDLIDIVDRRQIRYHIRYRRKIFKYCPKHIYINFKTLQIGIFNNPNLRYLTFPFKFTKRRFIEIYKI